LLPLDERVTAGNLVLEISAGMIRFDRNIQHSTLNFQHPMKPARGRLLER
jgi:hypothetical protein